MGMWGCRVAKLVCSGRATLACMGLGPSLTSVLMSPCPKITCVWVHQRSGHPLVLALTLGARTLTGSGAGSPSQGRSCTPLPLSPALSQSFADHSPPHPLPAPGGCPWCHKTGVPGKLPVSGSARVPATLWPQRAAPGAVRSGIRGWVQGDVAPGWE